VKDLQHVQYDLSVEPSDTVLHLKKTLEQEHNFQASWQKLIFLGKNLSDETTVAENKISEGNFLVLMVKKPKSAPTTSESCSSSSTSDNESIVSSGDEAADSQDSSFGLDLLELLRHMPRMNQIRQIFQQNPHLLGPLLSQIANNQPDILQFINQHQPELMSILTEGPSNFTTTQEDREAIDRLESLGFERSVVIEAYFACAKDENMAANFLLDPVTDQSTEDEGQGDL